MSGHSGTDVELEPLRPPRALHVAALPFPTYQGTQAAIASMLAALSQVEPKTALLTYATQGYAADGGFTVHRLPDRPRVRSLRSGPSLGKLLLDASMPFELQRLVRELRPSVLIAHHVEAAAVALTLRAPPLVFFAHTDLAEELPTYAPSALALPLRRAGGALDRWLVGHAAAVATISPVLCERLSELRPDVAYVPIPWSVPEPIRARERAESRLGLGISQRAKLALYAGNLDAYQGVELLPRALAALRRRGVAVELLLATQSEPSAFARSCRLLDVPLTHVALGDERIRRSVHAAADLVLVPRLTPGGLPIKLLDAMARGVPCVAMPSACAGLPLSGAVECAQGDSAAALALAVECVLGSTERRTSLAAAGRAYVAREHSAARFLAALTRVMRRALTSAADSGS
ncbi:MAG TPA: glycosyltransferase [Polyangiales bacterium]|nr:glycosyltransferase [Polyangiales bacterium]